jgi:phage tail tape-measure protein
MDQSDVVTATSTAVTGGVTVSQGAIATTAGKTAANAVSKSGAAAGVIFVGVSVYLDPSRENVVSELSTFLGGTAGGALGGLFCGAGSAATAGTASGSCFITIPGGSAIGIVLGSEFGDGVNRLWDFLESDDDDTPSEETNREEEQDKLDTRDRDSEIPDPATEDELR